jgi:FecR protein/Protein of unknown function (DUF3352)/Putative zinc-finger
MKLFRSKQDVNLDQVISELRGEEPEAMALSASTERVWQHLQTADAQDVASGSPQPIRGCADLRSLLPAFQRRELPAARALIVKDHLRECVSCRSHVYGRGADDATSAGWRMEPEARGLQWNFARLSLAAATVALLVVGIWAGRNWYVAGPQGNRAQIASVDGQAFRIGPAGESALKPGDEISEGEFIRTAANSHARLRLFEGSEVEMNQRAELKVSATRRDTTIHLDQGSIIVQAAKRHTGHLYVSAPDCTVAVTGTVFSVNSGTKGSRVAVIEGEVHVKHAGAESILHSGDVVATTQSVGVVPVEEEIGWSKDLDRELALLAEFSKLRAKLEEIPTPGPRYQSKILPLLPADTLLYIGVPNLGDALQQANRVFQEQLAQSQVLQEWWSKGKVNQHPTPQELIDQIHAISHYLGDEVVITAGGGFASNGHGPILLAEIEQPGLKEYLQNHLADTLPSPKGPASLHVVDPQTLSSLSTDERGMIMLVKPKMLVVSGDAASVRRMSAQLDSGASNFSATDFGQRIDNVYTRGTETLVAVNLGQIVKSVHNPQENFEPLRNSGFNDIKYLIATRGASSNQGDNRITLEFNGQRRGIASWLAAPAPMGSLDYVSSSAGAAVSFVAKQPALMLDDIFSTIGAADPNFDKNLAQTSSELGLDLRNDLASTLGGEMTLALDGPILPTPSWKAVIEVNKSGALQLAIEKLVQDFNREAQKSNRPSLTLSQTQVGGRTFYTIELQSAGLPTEFDYTFADGYMILAPSRALVLAALQTHANGSSLARSAAFRALLPSDNQANFSGVIYQNLSPILKPLASQLTSEQLTLLQQLAADAKPSVFCAYGESDRIEVASNGKLFDLNPVLPTLLHLLGRSEHGTSRQANP